MMKTNSFLIAKKNIQIKTMLFALATFTLSIALSPIPVAYAGAGDLDKTFGTNGQVITTFSGFAAGHAVAVQSDGKIVVVGEESNDFTIARYSSSGILDSSFGDGGIVTTDFSDKSDRAHAVAIQTDGKIVVAGSTGSDFALARYNSNGILDSSFGDGGKVTTNYSVSGAGDSGRAVAVQSDGKIVLAGYSYDSTEFEEFALLRYNSNGILDSSFGSGGIVITSIGDRTEDRAYAVAIETDGKIVLAGQSFLDFALARYTSAGELDTTFDRDGIVITDFGIDAVGYAVTVQTDGKIVVAGGSYVDVSTPSPAVEKTSINCIASNGFFCQYWDYALARYNSNGSLDSSFGDGGKVTTNLNPRGNDDYGRGVAIQTDGKIVVAGYSETSLHTFNGEEESFSTDNRFSLARYNSNGSLDTTFSADGIVITDIKGSSNEKGSAVAIQTDGKIIVAGTDYDTNAFVVMRFEVDEDVTPPVTPPNTDGGYNVGSELWIKGVLQVPNSPKPMVWKEVGTDITPSGDKVISGYFYVDPKDFAFGSVSNPEVFVKIYIQTNGLCNMAFNHVTVDDVTINSAHKYNGAPDQTGNVTLSSRLDEHPYNGVSVK